MYVDYSQRTRSNNNNAKEYRLNNKDLFEISKSLKTMNEMMFLNEMHSLGRMDDEVYADFMCDSMRRLGYTVDFF